MSNQDERELQEELKDEPMIFDGVVKGDKIEFDIDFEKYPPQHPGWARLFRAIKEGDLCGG